MQELQTRSEGLKGSESSQRLKTYGANILKPKNRSDALNILLSQFKNLVTLILLFATGLFFFLHDPADTLIIVAIVLISSILGFWQEKGAADAFEKPHHWDIGFIRKFMMAFGITSSIFDYLTFGVLLLLFPGMTE
ncbi:MAG: cation-transporting P-type ATPase [Methanosarcina sp.]|uniref:cation-transporting P-type ATPase n=1 Tax=Methanosarcina sp. TaxID=2213 RepID=UPI002604A2AB|nr:cation-transporting P-type ATPase [Methanosarcina sp.]MDD3245656.1 cation-transporting P-type ATPase [Methanosarcina sp.]MDD4248243.1 cation-transporting P-type ATPase [Methanosarcina sp.]